MNPRSWMFLLLVGNLLVASAGQAQSESDPISLAKEELEVRNCAGARSHLDRASAIEQEAMDWAVMMARTAGCFSAQAQAGSQAVTQEVAQIAQRRVERLFELSSRNAFQDDGGGVEIRFGRAGAGYDVILTNYWRDEYLGTGASQGSRLFSMKYTGPVEKRGARWVRPVAIAVPYYPAGAIANANCLEMSAEYTGEVVVASDADGWEMMTLNIPRFRRARGVRYNSRKEDCAIQYYDRSPEPWRFTFVQQ